VPLEVAQTGAIERVRVEESEGDAKTEDGRPKEQSMTSLSACKYAPGEGAIPSSSKTNKDYQNHSMSMARGLRLPPRYASTTISSQASNSRPPLSAPPVVYHHLTPQQIEQQRRQNSTLNPVKLPPSCSTNSFVYGELTSPPNGSSLGTQREQRPQNVQIPAPFSNDCGYNCGYPPNTAPANINYMDLDFMDLEVRVYVEILGIQQYVEFTQGLKSKIDTPLASRSRDDELEAQAEISSIVEELKRSEYTTSPTSGSQLLTGSFNSPSGVAGQGEYTGTVELAEADTTFWEDDLGNSNRAL